MIPRVGQKIGPYEILGRLGSGGMGLVFSAWDGRLHRDVAIKLLKDEFLNPTMRSRFLGEARAASRLNHPNICTIFDIGEEQDSPYLVMELLKGDTLRGRMQQGPIPVSTIIQVGTQVAEALSVAHEHGIIHRDVKPANVVLVDKPGGAFQTKVLDFGLAKVDLEGLDSHSGLTTTGMTVGTVSYMSPEQARGELLDGRSDLFALGVLMYEMATRKLPFDGATSALVFVQLLNHRPEPLRSLNATVPRTLEQVINTCLQKEREDRYQNAHDLILALQKAAQNLDVNEKGTSWLSRFASGLKRESTGQTPAELTDTHDEAAQTVSSLQMTSDEAFLRPFKPQRKLGSDSKHFEPINSPYPATDDRTSEANDAAAAEGTPVSRASFQVLPASNAQSSAWSAQPLGGVSEPTEVPSYEDTTFELAGPIPSGVWRVIIGSVLAVLIAGASIALVLAKRKTATPRIARSIALMPVVNHTGDSALADVASIGLELALEQSPWVGLQSTADIAEGLLSDLPQNDSPDLTRFGRFAEAHGAGAFAIPEIHMEGHTYVLSLHLYNSSTGAVVGECSSIAASRERLPGAVDGLAVSLRSVIGEPAASITASSLPLSKMATANMDALLAFREGTRLEQQGSVILAVEALQRAASLDQQFPQTRLRLASLLYRQHAAVGAATAANEAQAIPGGDELTKALAPGMQALFATGDLPRAAFFFTQLTANFPLYVEGYVLLAQSQREQGDFAGALKSAQRARRLAPMDGNAIAEEQLALIALERLQEALKLNQPTKQGSGSAASSELLTRFVDGDAVTPELFAAAQPEEDLNLQTTEAALLDATGQFASGLLKWRTVAQRALSSPAFVSTASFALSHAALDRALAGDCSTSADLVREASTYPASSDTAFALGMSSALCGNLVDTRSRLASLTAAYPQSWRVKGSYLSDLNAIVQWKSGALADSLATLQSAAQYDALSYNQYLQGQIYLAQKQPQPATVALQASLRHTGAMVQTNAGLLPVTYLTLARAFAANEDPANSGKSYMQVATILRGADPGNLMLAEAQAGSSR